jgi:TonB family protein
VFFRQLIVVTAAVAATSCVTSGHQVASTKPSKSPTSCANAVSIDTTIYETGHLSESPLARGIPPLEYPPEADRQKIGGRVLVEGVLNPAGYFEPASVKVIESVHPLLDQEAIRFVSTTSLWPGCRNGEAVRVRMHVPVTFARGSGIPSASDGFMIGLLVGLGALLGGVMAGN